jgi:hypothetical protein
MALDLKDIKRLGLTKEGKVWVARKATKHGISEQEVVRRLVHEKAIEEFTEAKVMAALSVAHDLDLDGGGREP